MAVQVLADQAAIVACLERRLAADPVRNTVIGSVLQTRDASTWCAAGTGPSEGAIAVRSKPTYPAVVTDGWHAEDLAELAGALALLPGLVGLSGPRAAVDAIRPRLPRPPAHRIDQRLFRLATLHSPEGVPGAPVLGAAAHREVLHRFVAAFEAEAGVLTSDPAEWVDRVLAGEGRSWLWCDKEEIVSLAHRRPVAHGSARIGPVYTPPQARGRGYAAAVTAHATRDILTDGAVPVLFTDLANPTSNAVYQRLGYRPVGDYAALIL
jgi:GNAT superfamily N-acetyltransferase